MAFYSKALAVEGEIESSPLIWCDVQVVNF